MLGLSNTIFHILWNIPNVVSIPHRGNACKHGIYVRVIVTNLRIGTKICCVRSRLCEGMILE